MKEATGELNLTLITIVAVALMAGLFVILYPTLSNIVENKWGGTERELSNVSN